MALRLPETVRWAVRLLSARALKRTAQRQYEDAWTDIKACYGFVDHLADRLTLVEEMTSIACESITHEATLQLLDQGELPAELADRTLAMLKSRQSRSNIAKVIDRGERIMALDSVIRSSLGKSSVLSDSEELGAIDVLAIDWNLVLRVVNEQYDSVVATKELDTWQDRQARLHQLDSELRSTGLTGREMLTAIFSRNCRSELLADLHLVRLSPTTSVVFDADDRANTQLHLMRFAAALAVHRAEEGVYPDTLDPLVPELLDRLPVDLFHQNPFVYRKTDNGYLLYSLGPNDQDDGGSNDRQRRYKGYRVEPYNETVLRGLLDEPAEDGETTDTPRSFLAELNRLVELIPADADDHAIRLPMPVIPLPDLVE